MEDTYTKFSKLELDSDLTRPVLITAINEAQARNGKPFLNINMLDGESEIQAKMFDMTAEALKNNGINDGMVVKALLHKKLYNGAPSYTVEKIERDNCGMTVENLVKMPPVDIDEMYGKVCELLESTKTEGGCTPLACLALEIIGENEKRFKTSSASIVMHHNMRGGLLYHTYRMMLAADALCGVYTSLDRELLLCGTALHDIGKIWEYKTSAIGSAEYTKQGVLFGHLYMGAALIKEHSKNGDYNKEKVMMLVHMILSHHGAAEWGAVKSPSFAEAFVLHYVDNIDAKLYMCEDHNAVLNEGEFTERVPFGLDNRLYRPSASE